MKQLLGIGAASEAPKTSLFYKIFDLEIPLLTYLKRHIENLESDLQSYSKKIADQQKREVLMDVAAQMAHDIVTPISNLQMILQNDDANKNQNLILLELGQIKNLSEKLLREYRGESSMAEQKRETIDVVESIHSALESAKVFAKSMRPVVFNFDCKKNEKVELVGDRSDFIAALSNILRNSVEALEKDNGVITVRLLKDFQSLKVHVSDNGCGIKEENLSKIFENKFSVGKKNGTGLGLFQVKSMIESMKGAIHVESKIGIGTTIGLTWPLCSESFTNGLNQKTIATQRPDLILIDDTNSNHVRWDIEARRAQKKLASFRSLDDFNSASQNIDRDTPIFVDYTFDNGPHTGKEIAERIVSAGFENVHIATALPVDRVDRPTGIKSVRGKDFPLAVLL
ncbi:MAG: sensor histidine kinase [Pseudobdellovibrionaceae bacterium]